MLTVKMDELHVGTFNTVKGQPGPKLRHGRLAAKTVKLKRDASLYKAPPNNFKSGDRVRIAARSGALDGKW